MIHHKKKSNFVFLSFRLISVAIILLYLFSILLQKVNTNTTNSKIQHIISTNQKSHDMNEIIMQRISKLNNHTNLLFDEISTNRKIKITRQKIKICENGEKFIFPECVRCIPGLVLPFCSDHKSKDLLMLRDKIYKMAVQRYGTTGKSGHLYPYLETKNFQRRQHIAIKEIKRRNAQNILDFGAYFNQLENFAIFDDTWCPKLILSIDPIYSGSSKGILCQNTTKMVQIIHAPLSAKLAMEDSLINSIHFDFVVCIGCDPSYGPTVQQLENFKTPYFLFLESAFQIFMQIPSNNGKLLLKTELHMSDPPKGTYFDQPYLKRMIRLIEFQDNEGINNILNPNLPKHKVCENAEWPIKASKCLFPFTLQTSSNTHGLHLYRELAEISEQIWTCRGLSAGKKNIPELEFGVNKEAKCHFPKNPQPDLFALSTCLGCETYKIKEKNFSQLCQCIDSCSITWRNSKIKDKSTIPEIVSIYHFHMKSIFKQHFWKDPSSCIQFPKKYSILCGGMQSYGAVTQELEPLYPGGRNLMFHERNIVIDFTSYLPLPSILQFDHAQLGRKVLIVVGANGFARATKFLMDMYSPYWTFDFVYMFEPHHDRMSIPKAYKKDTNISFMQMYVNVGGRDDSDIIKFIQSNFIIEDYVVVMFDVDESTYGPTIEWGFLADLTGQKVAIVDELFIELHMQKVDIGWHHDRHSSREQYDVMIQMRERCGFAVHAWP